MLDTDITAADSQQLYEGCMAVIIAGFYIRKCAKMPQATFCPFSTRDPVAASMADLEELMSVKVHRQRVAR